jgi:hypothetical protein
MGIAHLIHAQACNLVLSVWRTMGTAQVTHTLTHTHTHIHTHTHSRTQSRAEWDMDGHRHKIWKGV